MQVRELMTENPACCTIDTNLQEVARLMLSNDCGSIPVVDNQDSRRPVGVITDRDICCRTVAEGKNPLDLTAGDCMTNAVVTVTPDMNVDECCNIMESQQIRRVPVVDAKGACCGIVAQADIARHARENQVAEVVEEISKTATQSAGRK